MTCPHCGATARTYTEVNGTATHVREGCRGICILCRMWWQFEGGELVKYTPTTEEQVLVALDLLRRKQHAVAKGAMN